MINPITSELEILQKCITLLFRETLLEQDTEGNGGLVKSILDITKKSNYIGIGDVVNNLKYLIRDYIDNKDNYDLTTLIESLESILKDHESILTRLKNNLEKELSQQGLKSSITATVKQLNSYYNHQNIIKELSTASYNVNTNKVEDLNDYVNKMMVRLDALLNKSSSKDPGLVNEMDFTEEDTVSNVIDEVKLQKDGTTKLITGFRELNHMLGDGFRRGECVLINALQHKYKSGFTQSIFAQLAIHNKPVLKDNNKKPLIIYISFEDDSVVVGEFLYKYLYNNEFDKSPNMDEVSSKEAARYMKEKLSKNGYHTKVIRINPSEWTYKHLFNKILEYEAQGYEVHACLVDYLAKLPTTGCLGTGGAGTEFREMLNKCRNFFSSKEILFITPHQLSSDAKGLIRNGTSDLTFVKEIAGKGYTEQSKQIDQVVDLEIYIHVARKNRKPVLTVQRGKHRTPNIIDDKYMYFILEFPYKRPIKDTIHNDGNLDDSFDGGTTDDIGSIDF